MKVKLKKADPDLPGSKAGDLLHFPDSIAIRKAKAGICDIVEKHLPTAAFAKEEAGQAPVEPSAPKDK